MGRATLHEGVWILEDPQQDPDCNWNHGISWGTLADDTYAFLYESGEAEAAELWSKMDEDNSGDGMSCAEYYRKHTLPAREVQKVFERWKREQNCSLCCSTLATSTEVEEQKCSPCKRDPHRWKKTPSGKVAKHLR